MKKFYSSLFILFILQFANTKSLFSQTSLYSVKATTEKQIKPSSLILPFTENWSLASFEANGWIRDCDNWTINTQQGNLRPAAEFTWDPLLQNNYSCSLASDVIDGSQLYVGQIFLDVDIRLDNRYSTGDELLIIEVFNGTSWDSITSYSNNSGFDWESYHLDVTEQARGNNFQIRFQVSGQNSFDVISWFIDNISVYRTCAPPEDLTVAASYSSTTNDLYFLVAWSTPSILFPLQKPIQNNNSDNNINIVYNNQQHSGIQSDSATLLGFNIFRKLTNEPEYSLLNFIPFSGIQNYEYRDTDIFPDFYCYKVNCIWGATGNVV